MVDDSDPSFISKNIWMRVNSKSKSSVSLRQFGIKTLIKATFCCFDIEMRDDDQFMNINFRKLDVLFLLNRWHSRHK